MRTNPLLQGYHRLHYWYTMFTGTSYYHQPQRMGRLFVPGQLEGYFNDLTGKTNWKGKIDREGLPLLNTTTNGSSVYFPILLCQKALGHWDMWLIQGRAEDRQEFLKIACWLKDKQDLEGGWDTWGLIGQPPQYRYSAMTQGQAVSVMTRAYRLTRDSAFERACRSAVALMRKPVQDEGVSCYEGGDVFLEEFPGPQRDTVLNGWIFALFGVHDYLLQFSDDQVKAFYADTSSSLVRHLGEYDARFWSYYSSGTKRLASPFYHQLHLSQLHALTQVLAQPLVKAVLDMWTGYENNWSYKAWAVIVKSYQKLKQPSEIPIA